MRKFILMLAFGITFHRSIYADQRQRTAGTTIHLTDAQKLEIVEAHNTIRRKRRSSNMRYMTWDGELAWMAESYGRRCRYRHNLYTQHSKYPSVGENLYASKMKLDKFEMTTPIKKWNAEASNFNYYSGTCREGKDCGHYTQIVWATTFKVGCALTTCDFLTEIRYWNSIFFVCYYATAGNVFSGPDRKNVSVYEMGLACSGCDDGDYCRNRLCANSERDFIKPPDDAKERCEHNRTAYIIVVSVLSVALVCLMAWILLIKFRSKSLFKWNRCCWADRLREATRNAGTAMSPRPTFLTKSSNLQDGENVIPLISRDKPQLEVKIDSYGTTPMTELITTPTKELSLSLKRASRASLPKPTHPAPRSPPPNMPAPILDRA